VSRSDFCQPRRRGAPVLPRCCRRLVSATRGSASYWDRAMREVPSDPAPRVDYDDAMRAIKDLQPSAEKRSVPGRCRATRRCERRQ
jgi:hypothetical protein